MPDKFENGTFTPVKPNHLQKDDLTLKRFHRILFMRKAIDVKAEFIPPHVYEIFIPKKDNSVPTTLLILAWKPILRKVLDKALLPRLVFEETMPISKIQFIILTIIKTFNVNAITI